MQPRAYRTPLAPNAPEPLGTLATDFRLGASACFISCPSSLDLRLRLFSSCSCSLPGSRRVVLSSLGAHGRTIDDRRRSSTEHEYGERRTKDDDRETTEDGRHHRCQVGSGIGPGNGLRGAFGATESLRTGYFERSLPAIMTHCPRLAPDRRAGRHRRSRPSPAWGPAISASPRRTPR